MLEMWKDIQGYDGLYQVSNMGIVKSLDRIDCIGRNKSEIILKPCNNGKGYRYVTLAKDGKTLHMYIHRLVAMAFIDNPSELREVNHKNEEKESNQSYNLEWCDRKYNMNYGTVMDRICKKKRGVPFKNRRMIEAFDINTGITILAFSTIYKAMENGHESSGISAVCKGKRKTYHGYGWRYIM